MTIDADVLTTAKHFGIDPELIQAVVNAEGNIVRAVQCSIPSVTTRADALDVLCRSAVHALSDFVKNGPSADDFVQFWGSRWAPIGSANDPRGLNRWWVSNVDRLWRGGADSSHGTPATAPATPSSQDAGADGSPSD